MLIPVFTPFTLFWFADPVFSAMKAKKRKADPAQIRAKEEKRK